MHTEPVAGLARALDATGAPVAGVRERWTDFTSCPEWNVADLVGHIVSGNRLFAGILRGGQPDLSGGSAAAAPGGDLPASYRQAAGYLVAAFSRPGVLEEMFTVPFGTVPGTVALHLRITELLVHGLDWPGPRPACTLPRRPGRPGAGVQLPRARQHWRGAQPVRPAAAGSPRRGAAGQARRPARARRGRRRRRDRRRV